MLIVYKKLIKGFKVLIKEGPLPLIYKIIKKIKARKQKRISCQDQYASWLKKNYTSPKDRLNIESELNDFTYKPVISIITPVYNVDRIWFQKAIDSVFNQVYQNWELCIADDFSTKTHIRKMLESIEKKDSRVKIKYLTENQGISLASNEAISLATGEFVGLLDNDDMLAPIALYEVVKLLQKHPEADMIYSDEDKITTGGKRCDPFFKPDWSPDLFLSQMYVCHFGVYRKKNLDTIGGFKKGFEGSQDYDFVLRFTEKTEKIFHIPKILYHWRKVPGSTAEKYDAKDSEATSLKALNETIKRRSIEGTIEKGLQMGTFRVKRQIINSPLITIIIPTKDKSDYLRKCVNSIKMKTDYLNYEIIIVDNGSKEKSAINYLQSIHNRDNCKVLSYPGRFNFSAINNYASKKSKGEFLLFLNNDTEVITSGWLSAMLELCQREKTGAVGAKLLYNDNTIQHAGVLLGVSGIANHAFYKLALNESPYFINANVIRNYSAVTGACMMVRKSLFEDFGGFDEINLSISYSDIDFCLRLKEKGYLTVFTPYAVLYHHESVSRGYAEINHESNYMMNRWKNVLTNDPYYNINLTRDKQDFSLKI